MSSLVCRMQIKTMKAAGLRRYNPRIHWPALTPVDAAMPTSNVKKVSCPARRSRRGNSKAKA